MAKEFALNDPPKDGISNVRFTPAGHLVVSSWDCGVRLYDVAANSLKGSYQHKAAVLDAVPSATGGTTVFSGGLDCDVRSHDFASGLDSVLGSHTDSVKCLEHAGDLGNARVS